jgi:hypothetical protein
MARLASQMKSTLTLVCSVAVSVACGFASRRFDQPTGKWVLPACVGAVFFAIQLSLALLKSKEDVELSEFKRIQSAQNQNNATEIENRTRTADAITERMLLEIKSGKFEEAARWRDFQKDQHGK